MPKPDWPADRLLLDFTFSPHKQRLPSPPPPPKYVEIPTAKASRYHHTAEASALLLQQRRSATTDRYEYVCRPLNRKKRGKRKKEKEKGKGERKEPQPLGRKKHLIESVYDIRHTKYSAKVHQVLLPPPPAFAFRLRASSAFSPRLFDVDVFHLVDPFSSYCCRRPRAASTTAAVFFSHTFTLSHSHSLTQRPPRTPDSVLYTHHRRSPNTLPRLLSQVQPSCVAPPLPLPLFFFLRHSIFSSSTLSRSSPKRAIALSRANACRSVVHTSCARTQYPRNTDTRPPHRPPPHRPPPSTSPPTPLPHPLGCTHPATLLRPSDSRTAYAYA